VASLTHSLPRTALTSRALCRRFYGYRGTFMMLGLISLPKIPALKREVRRWISLR
jgi:hypothetical protein